MSKQPPSSSARLAFGTLVWFVIYRFTLSLHLPYFVALLFLGILWLSIFKTMIALFRDWRFSRTFRVIKKPTGIYGSTKQVGINELIAAGMRTDNRDGNGIPIGAIGKKMLFYHGDAHLSFRAATGGGKTESSFGPICFALGAHRNIIATGKGKEPACLIAEFRKSLGQDVRIIDIGNQMHDTGFETDDFNFVGHLVGLADCNDPALIDEAEKIAITLIPETQNSTSSDGDFFSKQARKWIKWLLVALAITEAETGELCCNLPYLYSLTCSGDTNFRKFLNDMQLLEHHFGTVKGAATRIIEKMENAIKTYESVLSDVENALAEFSPASPLGQRSVFSSFDPRDIKRIPMTIILVTDPTSSATKGKAAGLALEVLTNLALQANSFEPRVTILADEFANLSNGKLPSITPTLFVGRSLGVQLLTYVQDTSSYSTRYGEEATAFTTQADCTVVWRCRSVKDAEEYSKRSGMVSVMTESANVPHGVESGSDKTYSIGMSEKGMPRHRPDDFLHMKDFTGALLFKQLPPVMIDLVSYRQVLPWRDQAGTVPGTQALTDTLPIKFNFTK